MLTLVKLLRPLLKDGEDRVVLNTIQFSTTVTNIKKYFWGIGSEHTWHRTPDYCCDIVDMVHIGNMPLGDDREISGAKSESKTPVEVKAVSLTRRYHPPHKTYCKTVEPLVWHYITQNIFNAVVNCMSMPCSPKRSRTGIITFWSGCRLLCSKL